MFEKKKQTLLLVDEGEEMTEVFQMSSKERIRNSFSLFERFLFNRNSSMNERVDYIKPVSLVRSFQSDFY